MLKFKVTGMSCAACSARVERAVCAIPGAHDVSVNLLTGDLRVSGVSEESVVAAVRAAGYGIEEDALRANDVGFAKRDRVKSAEGKEQGTILVRFVVSLGILLPLM